MKVTFPVHAYFTCSKEVACVVLLKGFDDFVIICDTKEQIWGNNGIYSETFLISFDTKSVHYQKNILDIKNVLNYKDIENITFPPKKDLSKYLQDNYYAIRQGEQK